MTSGRLRNLFCRTSPLALAVLLASASEPAGAQTHADAESLEPSESGAAFNTDEIIVTATRSGAQSIQNIPLSITAVDPEAMQRQGNETLADISRNVPGVFVQEEGGGQNKIVIRGINTNAGIQQTDTAEQALVSVYLDDVPISIQGATPDIRVFDLERVEFLRGPQGTLFGAGAMAGTVRYITRKPNLTEFEASAEGSLAATKHGEESYSVRGMMNLPLATDRLGLRVTAYHGKDGGYIDNVAGEDNFNDLEMTQVRSVLRYSDSKITADLSWLYGTLENGGNNTTLSELGDYEYGAQDKVGVEDRFHIINFAPQIDLGGVTLLSSTGYIDRSYKIFQSQEYYTQGLLGFSSPSATAVYHNRIKDFTQELRLATDASRPLRAQIGAFYQRQTRGYEQTNDWSGMDAAIGIDSRDFGAVRQDQLFRSDTFTKTKQLALFGEITYSPVPNLDLVAGLRYFDWKQRYTLFSAGLGGVDASGQPLTLTGKSKANGVNPKASVTYRVDDNVMVYAEAARGFRYGGVNQVVPLDFCGDALAADGLTSAPVDYDPDKLWTYSIGEKAQFLDRKVTLNVAAFLTNWDNVQTRHYLDECGYYFTQNAGKVRSQGLELESRFRPLENLTLSATGSYTDAKTRDPLPDLNALKGDRVPYFPRYLLTLGAEYEIPLNAGSLILQGDFSYRSATGTRFNPADSEYRTNPSSHVFNAAITWQTEDMSISIYGRNLTDDYVVTSIANNPFPSTQPGDTVTIARPQTFGIRMKTQF
ncbi:TonB-dependent receptor [Sphingosinicella sp.]|uniref:TonB-dependent receptor n=1 Tax=Sphingosinicella sp. TaxID=1917971 RepID=UPI0035B3BBDB